MKKVWSQGGAVFNRDFYRRLQIAAPGFTALGVRVSKIKPFFK